MPIMKQTIEILQGSGVRDNVKVMIGGAPVTKKADDIGADDYTPDAGSANKTAKKMIPEFNAFVLVCLEINPCALLKGKF